MDTPVNTELVLADFLEEYNREMDKLAEAKLLRNAQATLAKDLGQRVITLLTDRLREKGMQLTITRLPAPPAASS